jgi:hypothetical protein
MTATGSPLSARAQRLAGMLATWPRQRVQLVELWSLLDEVDPTSRMDIRRRRILSELVAELAGAQVVELPSARSYDHIENPPLPRFLVIRREAAGTRPRKPAVWHPALAWVPRAGLTRSQEDTIEQVNQWLYQSHDRLTVPSRERSLEVFGDEKALDRLVGTVLFGPGRLTLELLRCRRVVPRLHCESAGDGDVLLVVENSDTFNSILTVLRDREDHRVGLVGWGAGTGFEASVLSIPLVGRPISGIRYFGDLDENGLRIPANASTVAQAEGLTPVVPAPGLYDALLQRGVRRQGQRQLLPDAAAKLAGWLDPPRRAAAATLLTDGARMAQEAVGLSYLTSHEDWLVGIRK